MKNLFIANEFNFLFKQHVEVAVPNLFYQFYSQYLFEPNLTTDKDVFRFVSSIAKLVIFYNKTESIIINEKKNRLIIPSNYKTINHEQFTILINNLLLCLKKEHLSKWNESYQEYSKISIDNQVKIISENFYNFKLIQFLNHFTHQLSIYNYNRSYLTSLLINDKTRNLKNSISFFEKYLFKIKPLLKIVQ